MQARARVELDGDTLRVIPVGLAKLWAGRGSVSIRLARITEVHTFDEPGPWGNRVKAGRFRAAGVKAFLVVGPQRPVVVVECPGAKFDRVVFSADEPETIVRDITRALPSQLP